MLARIFGDRQDLAVAYHESLATDATTRVRNHVGGTDTSTTVR